MRFLIVATALGTALAALLAAGPSLAADTPRAKAKAERACFRPDDVNGFNVVDDQTVDVSINARTVYRLTLFSRSPDIDWTQRIGIRARGGSWICTGMDAEIIVPGSIGPNRFPVTDIRKLTPEELAFKKKK